MSRRSRPPPNPREARAELLNYVTRLRYPVYQHNEIVTQLAYIWTYYRLEPVILPNPLPPPASSNSHHPPHLLCMKGNLEILVKNPPPPKQYPIPIQVHVLLSFPHVLPLISVIPYPGACVPPNHPFVSTTGVVNLSSPAIPRSIWRPAENSLPQILARLKDTFGYYPPLIADATYLERAALRRDLTSATAARLASDTTRARTAYTALHADLASLRRADAALSSTRHKTAPTPAHLDLASTRESLVRIRALTRDYGVEPMPNVKGFCDDIPWEALVAISSGNPLRDHAEALDASERAASDALDAAGDALKSRRVALDDYMAVCRGLAGDLARTRAAQQKVERDMSDAVEAEIQAAKVEAAGGGGGVAKGAPRAAVSSLLTSGMFPVSYVRRGRRERENSAVPGLAGFAADGGIGAPLPPPVPGNPINFDFKS